MIPNRTPSAAPCATSAASVGSGAELAAASFPSKEEKASTSTRLRKALYPSVDRQSYGRVTRIGRTPDIGGRTASGFALLVEHLLVEPYLGDCTSLPALTHHGPSMSANSAMKVAVPSMFSTLPALISSAVHMRGASPGKASNPECPFDSRSLLRFLSS